MVVGKSMEPTYTHGTRVIACKKLFAPINKNDIIIAKDPRNDRLLIKRIKDMHNNLFLLLGDNKEESTDSRQFGWVKKKDIIARVIYPKP